MSAAVAIQTRFNRYCGEAMALAGSLSDVDVRTTISLTRYFGCRSVSETVQTASRKVFTNRGSRWLQLLTYSDEVGEEARASVCEKQMV